MQLKYVGKIKGGSTMLEPSPLGREDGGTINQGSKHEQVSRFWWGSR